MRTRRLERDQFKATMTPNMQNVTETANAVLDIWPYVDTIPSDDLEGHDAKDVEFVYRSGDARFEHVLIATAAKNVYLCIVVDLVNATVFGHHLLDLNEEYGVPASDLKREDSTKGFICKVCGQFHADLPMDFGVDAPAPYYAIPEIEREARCELTSDVCMIDSEYFLIRGCLEIPVLDGPRPFVWGVWASLSEQNFKRAGEMWETPGRESEPPYFGWLCTSLPLYPETLHLKTHVHTRPVGQRPFVELEPTEHPLAVEQRNGITMDRVREIAEALLHPGKKKLWRRI